MSTWAVYLIVDKNVYLSSLLNCWQKWYWRGSGVGGRRQGFLGCLLVDDVRPVLKGFPLVLRKLFPLHANKPGNFTKVGAGIAHCDALANLARKNQVTRHRLATLQQTEAKCEKTRGKKVKQNQMWKTRGKKVKQKQMWKTRGKKVKQNQMWKTRGKKLQQNKMWKTRGKKVKQNQNVKKKTRGNSQQLTSYK